MSVHNLLVEHRALPVTSTHGHVINGYSPRCDTCRKAPLPPCWCGGEVGPRVPGDDLGLGCLTEITHMWSAR